MVPRPSLLAMFRLMPIAGSAVLAATAVAACGGHVTITINGGPVAPSPVTFRPAKVNAEGSITGTYFRATLPAGWVNAAAFFARNPNVEVAIKQGPTTATGPGIIVTLAEAPADLPLAPYADISFHRWIADKTAGKIHLITGLKSASIAGEQAEDFTTSNSGNTYWTIYVLYNGVAYTFQLVAPSSQFATARSGPFRAFLASWQWR
jgi:hypothetical protein